MLHHHYINYQDLAIEQKKVTVYSTPRCDGYVLLNIEHNKNCLTMRIEPVILGFKNLLITISTEKVVNLLFV